MSFFALIILTIYPHRQPTWGVSDWVAGNLNRTPHAHTYAHTHTQSHIHISAYHAQQSCTCIEYRIHIYAAPQQYRCTQSAHRTQHRTQNKHNIRTQNNLNTENSAHNYRTYSFDLYHEYVCIKNSNTIELYTISKENI